MAIESQILAVLVWLAVLKLVQLALWPALAPLFGKYAYPVSFSASVLGLSLLAWYLGTVGLPVQLALAPFLVLLGWFAYRRAYTRDVFAEHWRWDAVFLVLFVFMLECRYINPSASFAEKFMDHGFVASIMRTPIVPPWDPWFAGGHLNVYYYYGSWIMGVLGLSTGVPSRLVFNLGLPTVLALAGVNCYMVGHLLLKRYRWLPVLPLILPNPASVVLAAQGVPLSKVAWDSTRVITDTINEYPLFSFTWGDLHAHVIGIFNQAFLIALLVLALSRWTELSERARLALIGLVALSLGAMPGINSWDVLLDGPITLLVAAFIWFRHRHDADGGRITPLYLLIAAPVLAIALYAPYYPLVRELGDQGDRACHRPLRSGPVPARVRLLPRDRVPRLHPGTAAAAVPCRRGNSVPAGRVRRGRDRGRTARMPRGPPGRPRRSWPPRGPAGCARPGDCDLLRTRLPQGQHGRPVLPDEHGLQVLHRGLAPARYRHLRDGRPLPRPAADHGAGGSGAALPPAAGSRSRSSLSCSWLLSSPPGTSHTRPIRSMGPRSSTANIPGTQLRSGSCRGSPVTM